LSVANVQLQAVRPVGLHSVADYQACTAHDPKAARGGGANSGSKVM